MKLFIAHVGHRSPHLKNGINARMGGEQLQYVDNTNGTYTLFVGATGAGKKVQLEVEIEIQEGSDSVSRHIQDSEAPPGIMLTVYPGPAHAMGSECEVGKLFGS
jgi:hypothetical protein